MKSHCACYLANALVSHQRDAIARRITLLANLQKSLRYRKATSPACPTNLCLLPVGGAAAVATKTANSSARQANDDTPDRLRENVKNGVGEALHVQAPPAGALAENPHDGVASPAHSSDEGDLLVELVNFLVVFATRVLLGGFVHAKDQVVDYRLEYNHAKAPEAPLLVTTNEGADETSDDHDEVSAKKPEKDIPTSTSDAGNFEEHKGGGESPINVTGVVEFTAVVSASVNVVLAVTHGHGEVSEGGNEADEHGHEVESAATSTSEAEGFTSEVTGGYKHAPETSPKVVGTSLSDLFTGV